MAAELDGQGKMRLEAGETLFEEGEISKDLYVVQFGSVRVFKSEGDIEVELDVVGPGGIVGEVAAIDGGPRSASAVAVETTELLVISVDNFKGVVDKIPDWFKKIARILVQRLREVDSRIHNTMGGNCVAHLAAFVNLMTYSPVCETTEAGLEIPMKAVENDAVDLLGLQVNDVSAAIEALGKTGFVTVTKNKMVVTDRTGLEEFGKAVFQNTASSPVI